MKMWSWTQTESKPKSSARSATAITSSASPYLPSVPKFPIGMPNFISRSSL